MKAKDLAKKLGVSPATISLVLNNKPGISDSLRKSLLEKIQQLGHEEMLCQSCREGEAPGAKPAPATKQKEGSGCKVIAYLVYSHFKQDMNDPYHFFNQVLEGIEAEAWENDCCIVMLHMNKHKDLSITEQLRRTGNVVGAIAHPCKVDQRVEEDMKRAGIPCVFMDTYVERGGWEPSSVCISNRQGVSRAVRYLMEKGHREIGYVSSGWESDVELERRRAFHHTLEGFGLADRPEHYFEAGTGDELFEFQRLADRFAKAQSLPTALLCENDRQAWRAIRALGQIGKRVPEDVSVIGFDDQAICTAIEPHITSVHNSPQLMGRECVMMLNNLIRLRELGEEDPWLRYELPATLVERDSVRDITER